MAPLPFAPLNDIYNIPISNNINPGIQSTQSTQSNTNPDIQSTQSTQSNTNPGIQSTQSTPSNTNPGIQSTQSTQSNTNPGIQSNNENRYGNVNPQIPSTNEISQTNFANNAHFVNENQKYQNYIKNNQIAGNRPAWNNITNTWPNIMGSNMFNRFQTPVDYLSDTDQIIALLKEISFILKIIVILFILFFIANICNKNNN